MVQPVIGAIDAWLAIYTYIPFPVRALIGLAVSMFIASRIILVVWQARR